MAAPPSGISLTDQDAAVVKGMLARGDRQHDIAAWFGVNGGRIAEISTGVRFSHVAAQTSGLPPAGPYISAKTSYATKDALSEIRGRLQAMIDEIDELLKLT